MSAKESKFDIWWNSPSVRRMVGIVYSLGASIVIIGAMFKILHLPGAAQVLGIGMTVEALLFALGIFDRPHKEFEWDKIFEFDGSGKQSLAGGGASTDNVSSNANATGRVSASANIPQVDVMMNDDDVKKLSEGIRNLTETAYQFASLSNVMGATEEFTKNIDTASKITGKFVQSQESLNGASNKLAGSYLGITNDMDEVVKNTKLYSGKVEDVTKNLSSINSIYEIQLKNIQTQSEALMQQTEQVRLVSNQMELVVSETQKMKAATVVAATEAEKYKEGTQKLSKQIADLNQVYGNMLNALS